MKGPKLPKRKSKEVETPTDAGMAKGETSDLASALAVARPLRKGRVNSMREKMMKGGEC